MTPGCVKHWYGHVGSAWSESECVSEETVVARSPSAVSGESAWFIVVRSCAYVFGRMGRTGCPSSRRHGSIVGTWVGPYTQQNTGLRRQVVLSSIDEKDKKFVSCVLSHEGFGPRLSMQAVL